MTGLKDQVGERRDLRVQRSQRLRGSGPVISVVHAFSHYNSVLHRRVN